MKTEIITNPYIVLAMFMGAALGATAFVMLTFGPGVAEQEQQKEYIDFALPRLNQGQLIKMATLIVSGEIVAQASGEPEKIDTPRGQDILIPQQKSLIKIDRVLRGNYDKPTVEVYTPESSERIIVEQSPNLKHGERCIFLLFKWEDKYQLAGLRHGCVKADPDKFSKDVLGIDKEEEQQQQKQQQREQQQSAPPRLNDTEMRNILRIVT